MRDGPPVIAIPAMRRVLRGDIDTQDRANISRTIGLLIAHGAITA